MSLFQCDKCGCVENTALTRGYHCRGTYNHDYDDGHPAMISYKEILGLKPKEKFGAYCSACCPVWFTKSGNYGVGKNPNPKPEEGLWHGVFERRFFPLGSLKTDSGGNMVYKKTGKPVNYEDGSKDEIKNSD